MWWDNSEQQVIEVKQFETHITFPPLEEHPRGHLIKFYLGTQESTIRGAQGADWFKVEERR